MRDQGRPRARLELPGPVRSLAELRFFLAEAPCDRCKKVGLACASELIREGRVLARCAHCDTRRELIFAEPPSSVRPPAFSLAEGSAPSALFDAARLWAIATRELGHVSDDPTSLLTLHEICSSRRRLARARTALTELAKLGLPDEMQQEASRRAVDLWDRHQAAAASVESRPRALACPAPTGGAADVAPGAIERVLARDEALLAVRDDGTSEALLLFALVGGRPVLRASSRNPSDVGDTMRERLRALGIRQGRTYSPGEYFWSSEAGLTIWSRERMLAEGRDGVLEIGSETLIRKADAKRVISFLDEDDDGHRGVAVDLRDGLRVVVVEEHDPSAHLDPTYGMDNLGLDSAWATFLGRELAAWLGVEHVDQLP